MGKRAAYDVYFLKLIELSMGKLSMEWIVYDESLVRPSPGAKMPTAHKFVVFDNKTICVAPIDSDDRNNAFCHRDIWLLANVTRLVDRNLPIVGSGAINIRGEVSSWHSAGGLPQTEKKRRQDILAALTLQARFSE